MVNTKHAAAVSASNMAALVHAVLRGAGRLWCGAAASALLDRAAYVATSIDQVQRTIMLIIRKSAV